MKLLTAVSNSSNVNRSGTGGAGSPGYALQSALPFWFWGGGGGGVSISVAPSRSVAFDLNMRFLRRRGKSALEIALPSSLLSAANSWNIFRVCGSQNISYTNYWCVLVGSFICSFGLGWGCQNYDQDWGGWDYIPAALNHKGFYSISIVGCISQCSYYSHKPNILKNSSKLTSFPGCISYIYILIQLEPVGRGE